MTDEQTRIRGYLQAQGAKQTPTEIIAKVEAAMADLATAARAVPGTRFAERPEPEEWSANEVLAHVVTADTYFGGGVVAILEGWTSRSSTRSLARSTGVRRCSSRACMTSITPGSSARSPPRSARRRPPDERRDLAAAGHGGLGAGQRLRRRGRAAGRAFGVDAGGVGPRRRRPARLPRRAPLAHPAP